MGTEKQNGVIPLARAARRNRQKRSQERTRLKRNQMLSAFAEHMGCSANEAEKILSARGVAI